MFSKTEKVATRPQVRTDGAPSIISANLRIVGNLETEGEIQVDGIVDGDVTVKALTVGANATVNGEIKADAVVVRGTVNGRIKARTVELATSAKVTGDIWHESLTVEAGAYLEGHCKRWDGSEEAGVAPVQFVKDEPAPDSGPDSGEDVVVARPLPTGAGGRP